MSSTARLTLGEFSLACRAAKVPMSRATFYRTLRGDPLWLQLVDARENARGVSFLRAEAEAWITQRAKELSLEDAGTPLGKRSERASRFFRECPECTAQVHVRLAACGECGGSVQRPAA